jgi:protein TonB
MPVIVKQEPDIKPMATVSELDKMDISVTGTPTGTSATGIEASGTGGTGSTAAANTEKAEEPEILKTADVMPEFPGGLEALKRFLGKNLRMPSEDQAPETAIRVVAHFVVDKDGSISAVDLMQSGGKAYDNEVKRVLSKMPHWKPGMQHGKPVAVYFYLPVVFQSLSDQ